MFTVIGIVFGIICVFTGYLLHGGGFAVFIAAWTEFITILGGAFGIFLAGNGLDAVKAAIAEILHLIKPNAYTRPEYVKLLTMLYQICTLARREGLLAVEAHLENPEKSSIIGSNHVFLHDHHAKHFFCDTMKMVVSGGVDPIALADMMEADLEIIHAEALRVPDAIQNTGDAMPAVGIVACVLGVVITMGRIGGDPAAIGQAIAVALIGTFLGIFAAYIVFFPLARALNNAHRGSGQYLKCISHVILSIAKGESPVVCIEFARRNIEPSARPSFEEMDQAMKNAKKS